MDDLHISYFNKDEAAASKKHTVVLQRMVESLSVHIYKPGGVEAPKDLQFLLQSALLNIKLSGN